MKLQDRVAIITGAASGMGRATARLFAEEGAKVVVADIDTKGGEETVKSINDSSGKATFVEADVSKVADMEKMVRQAVRTYGKLDILYNNAGTPGPVGIETLDEEEWDMALDINLKGGVFATRFAVPEMRKVGRGSILFTSSIVGFRASPRKAMAYAASKGAVTNVIRSMALLLGPDNIRVNAICPSATDTPMFAEFAGLPKRSLVTPEMMKMTIDRIPLKRMGKPEDIARAALFLASDDSSFITGHNLVVDGGYSL